MLDKTKKVGKKTSTLAEQLANAPIENVVIKPINIQRTVARIKGTVPLVVNNFGSTNRTKMVQKQLEGSRAKKGTARVPKNFDALYQGTFHKSTEGWYGFPASALRKAMVSASRVAGFAMTRAKLSVFVVAEGIDDLDGQGLVRIQGEPTRRDWPVRLADGSTDIMPRPFFDNWEMDVVLEWDADQFSASDVFNLLTRAGVQVGLGAGRPDSKNSCGMGWGTFKVLS